MRVGYERVRQVGNGNAVGSQIAFTVRYDDFSEVSQSGIEQCLVDLMLERGVPCTFAVVPFACDPEDLLKAGNVRLRQLSVSKAAVLRSGLQAGLVEIALHGYSHLTLAPLRYQQEFSDRMPVELQRRLLRRGREHLEDLFGTEVRTYVPPWNRIASNTFVALREEGLMLSGGSPYAWHAGLPWIGEMPCSLSLKDSAAASDVARRFGSAGTVVGINIHDYDFLESGSSYAHLDLSTFDRRLGEWVKHSWRKMTLLSSAIREFSNPDSAFANQMVIGRLERSRVARRLWPVADKVYWDVSSARRLAKLLKFLP